MPIQTQIKFKDFIKAIWKYGNQHFGKCVIIPKRGSKRRIELFGNRDDKEPYKMWVAHEDRYVWSGDLKKAYTNLEITKEEFLDVINSL